jgi:hypothetical protein
MANLIILSGEACAGKTTGEIRPPGAIYLPCFDTGEYADASLAFNNVKAAFTEAGCAVSFQS